MIQVEHGHIWIELFSLHPYAFQITGYVILMAFGNVTNGDIGAFFHELIFRENEQRVLSKRILYCKRKKKADQLEYHSSFRSAPLV